MTLLDLELGPQLEPDFFRTPEDVYATGLMFLAERFHHLLDAEDDLGLIVVDSRFREDDHLRTLLPRFARHPATGELEGVGLKRFPEQVPREHGRHRLF